MLHDLSQACDTVAWVMLDCTNGIRIEEQSVEIR